MAISAERNNAVLKNWKCILISFGMAAANFQYGIDVASISGFQAMVGFLEVFGYEDPKAKIGWSIETQPQQLIASCLNMGTIIGLFFTTWFAKYYGRRHAIWLGSALAFIAAGIQIGTTSLAGLCVGRVLIGTSNAFYMTFANVYIVEVTPPHMRAVIASFFGIWVNIGNVLGSVVNNFTKNIEGRHSYQIPLAILYIVPVLLSIMIFFVPESPRWLLVQGKTEEAEKSLKTLRGDSLSPEIFREEFVEMCRGIEEEKAIASGRSFFDIFRGTDLRRTIICLGVTLTHSSSGLWIFLSYSTYFFQMGNVENPFVASILYSLSMMLGTMMGMYFMFYLWGRRAMMLFGHICGALCMLAIAVAYTVAPGTVQAGKAIVGFSFMFGFLYSGWSGTLSWPLAGETVSSRLRVVSMSVSTGTNYFFAWLISYCTPYFINASALNWGPKYMYIWAGSNVITCVFLYFMLPDYRGRSLEEIDELFEKKVGVYDFQTFECQTSAAAHVIAVHDMEEKGQHQVAGSGSDRGDTKASSVEQVESK